MFTNCIVLLRYFLVNCIVTMIVIFNYHFSSSITCSRSVIIRPKYSWTEYKTVVKAEFYTSRTRNIFTAQWVRNKYEFLWSLSESCEQECNKLNVTLQVAYKNKRINSAWSLLGNVTYLYKNCDKLYWTNWIETASCSLLRHWDYTRNCEDCDGNEVDEKHCNGNSTIQKDRQPIWSEWIEGDCIVTGCNQTVWERVRTRKCFYGDGKEATQSELCFHQSTTMKKQCNAIKLPSECEQFPSN